MGRRRKKDYILPRNVYRHGRKFRLRIYADPARRPAWHTFKADTVEALYREYGRYLRQRDLMTLGHVFDRYEAQEVPRKASATRVSDLAALRQLRPVFGTMRPGGIRRQHVVAYLDNRGAVAPIRANRERALLSHILTKATHWGVLDVNPILGLQYRNPEPPRTRYVTDRELLRAMRIAPPIVRLVMRLVYLTGLRRKDVLGITWGDISEEGIAVTVSKSRRAGVAPKRLLFEWSAPLEGVTSRARRWRHRWQDNEPLFPISEAGFARTWTAFQDDFERAGFERFYLRDLRAKYATDAAERGLDATTRLAHSSPTTTRRHYTQRRPTRIKPDTT